MPAFLKSQQARVTWFADPDVRDWLARTPSDPVSQGGGAPHRSPLATALGRMIANTGPAIENLERLLGTNGG